MTRSDVRTVQKSVRNHFFRAFSKRLWLTRSLWLAAWSFWLWLGFGLYRELPRDLGRLAVDLKGLDKYSFAGFLEPESHVVTHEYSETGGPSHIKIWDASSGIVIRKLQGPLSDFALSPQGDFAIGVAPGDSGRDEASAILSSLNLRTGEWKRLPADLTKYRAATMGAVRSAFHPVQPWIMCWEEALEEPIESDDFGVVIVFDLKSGAELFRWVGGPQANESIRLSKPPFFIDEQLGIPTRPLPQTRSKFSLDSLAIWSIPKSDAPSRVIKGLCVGDDPNVVKGRIAWATRGHAEWMDVYDLRAERIVFSYPPVRSGTAVEGETAAPLLFNDGRTLEGASKFWDIDTGKELRPQRSGEVIRVIDEDGFLEYEEDWGPLVKNLTSRRTYVLRHVRTGEFIHRTWSPTLFPRTRNGAFHGTWDQLAVHELPPLVNHPLLAVCQSILALPLVLLWAALRWRRKRRTRMASVTS